MAKADSPSEEIAEAMKLPTITPEALHALGIMQVSRGRLYRACKAGEIECIRIGRKIIIPTGPLRRLLGIGTQPG